MSLIYFLLSLILSGMLGSPLSGAIILCAVLAPAVDVFARRFLGAPRVDVRTVVLLAPQALLCLPVIVREAAASNISLLRLMMSGSLEIEPCIVRIRTKLRTRAGRSALSALLTLSSGCISLIAPSRLSLSPAEVCSSDALEEPETAQCGPLGNTRSVSTGKPCIGDEFIFVHALTREDALAAAAMPFERILLKMEEKINA